MKLDEQWLINGLNVNYLMCVYAGGYFYNTFGSRRLGLEAEAMAIHWSTLYGGLRANDNILAILHH